MWLPSFSASQRSRMIDVCRLSRDSNTLGTRKKQSSGERYMMRLWKAFAWIALIWSVVARRGKGVLIRKTPSKGNAEPEPPESHSGPGWRRISWTKAASGGDQYDAARHAKR